MGFMDKLKGAVNAVTGAAAKVTIEYPPGTVFPGDGIAVKVSATSTGQAVTSKGISIDLHGEEIMSLSKRDASVDGNVSVSKRTFSQEFQIAPAFVLAANETQYFEGAVQLPGAALPSFRGHFTEHRWTIRGRVEAPGNDPDSGFQPLRVGSR